MNEIYQLFRILLSPTSCLPNPVASPFASLVRATGRVTGCHSCPNATATMKCCCSPSGASHRHPAACWMIASVAPVIPWPHTGTGGSPRYTPLDPTQTPPLKSSQSSDCVLLPVLLHRLVQVSVATKSSPDHL